jgi:hypothetical protein
VVLVSATDKRQRVYCCQAQPVSNSLAVAQSKHGAGEPYNWKIALIEQRKKTDSTVFLYDDVRVFLVNSINNCIFAK